MHSLAAAALLHTVCGLYLKGSRVGSTFLKECFISGQPLTKEVKKLYLAQSFHLMHMVD